MKKLALVALNVSCAALLSACGGGGDDSSAPSGPPVLGQNGAIAVGAFPVSEDSSCGNANFAVEMLKAINAARAAARSCGSAGYAPAKALGWNELLSASSASQAEYMASIETITGVDAAGADVTARVSATGYDYHAVGENLAKGYPTVSKLMTALLQSPEHCQKIMSANISEVGAACVKAANGVPFWVQTFGLHRSAS
jgi:uncharacterized protein YkwD